MRRNASFTLVEIMIVVAIIALLAAIAVPSFLRARRQAQNARFLAALRVARDAFEMYAAEHNSYPPDELRTVIPSEMSQYFGTKLDWTAPTPIGGDWDWDYQVSPAFSAGVSILGPTAPLSQMQEIDAKIDDGNLATGGFRDIGSRYTSVIE